MQTIGIGDFSITSLAEKASAAIVESMELCREDIVHSAEKILKSVEGDAAPLLKLSFKIKVNLHTGEAEFQLGGSTKFKVVSDAVVEKQLNLQL